MQGPRIHELKVSTQTFEKIHSGSKLSIDHPKSVDFQVKDTIVFCEWKGHSFTGRRVARTITNCFREIHPSIDQLFFITFRELTRFETLCLQSYQHERQQNERTIVEILNSFAKSHNHSFIFLTVKGEIGYPTVAEALEALSTECLEKNQKDTNPHFCDFCSTNLKTEQPQEDSQ